MDPREMDADGRTFTVSGGIMTRAEKGQFFAKAFAEAFEGVFGADEDKAELVDQLVATEHFDADDAGWLEEMAEAQLEFLVASTSGRPAVNPMPGIEIRKTVRANETAVEEPELLPSGHFAMPGIVIGRR
jgi:hypothetical protein